MVYEDEYIEIDEDGNIYLILYSDMGDGTIARDDRMKVGVFPSGLRATLPVGLTDWAQDDYDRGYDAAESYFHAEMAR